MTVATRRKIATAANTRPSPSTIASLRELERKVLWLSSWMIHNANHVRTARDGLKVGGHQTSCASAATLLTALYMDVLTPHDRVAVKPHAAPVFHAIQYLLGNQSLDMLRNFRAFGGAQSYPSRTKDTDGVDFSTGSVGLGVATTLFASLVQDYVHLHGLAAAEQPMGRMIALMGDAELDEGNVFEALLEGWKHDVRNLWWVIDYNRQSLDGVINHFLFQKINDFFRTVDWNVIILKYGKRLEAAFEGPAGGALRRWIDECPNPLYSALVFKGGDGWRQHLKQDLKGTQGLRELLDSHDNASLHGLMTNLAGHDTEAVLDAFHSARDDTPYCFVAYTVKGFGLPLAGHKDNHSGLMTPDQMDAFKDTMGIPDGAEWDKFAGLSLPPEALAEFLETVPFKARSDEPPSAPPTDIPLLSLTAGGGDVSTQETFGRIMNDLAKGDHPMTQRIVTTSPDVTVSTNLGGWVNQRRVFHRQRQPDVFRQENVPSVLKWSMRPNGQHIELGIAENNLFLLLAALGLSEPLFGARLLPVGTLYDPFVSRGLDALNYACYQGARFMMVGTPSGITLAPEGGAHQSIVTPLIGIGQDGLTTYEPAFADELAVLMEWGFAHMQAPDGGAVYLRLSTRPLPQPARDIEILREDIIAGAYWLRRPAPGAELAIVYMGTVAAEAMEAHAAILEDIPGAGLLAVTSADRLHAGWMTATRAGGNGMDGPEPTPFHIERLLSELAPDASLVTVLDGHPASLDWLGSLGRHRVMPLGVDQFGQSGDIPDLFKAYGIDTDAILDAVARASLKRLAL